MSSELERITVASTVSPLRPDAEEVIAQLRKTADMHEHNSRAASTWRVYTTDWRLFAEWVASVGRPLFPEGEDAPDVFMETVRLYVAHLAEQHRSPNTMSKKLSSISVAYGIAGVRAHKQLVWNSSITAVMKGVRRQRAEDGTVVRKVTALRTQDLKKMLKPMRPDVLMDARDRAMILVQYAGAFRRSEVASLDIADFKKVDEGLEVVLRRSKTDQDGKGITKGLPYGAALLTCPVRAWEAWLKMYGQSSGPAFPAMTSSGTLKLDQAGNPKRTEGRYVADVIQRRARLAKMPGDWGGHSPRRGLATEALANGAHERAVMKQGGWKSTQVMRGYADAAETWQDNAAGLLNL